MKKVSKQDIPKSIDEYLQPLPQKVRATLETLRNTIKAVAPHAEETISYQMPAFKYNGMLVFFAAFSDHCSLFPGPSAIQEFAKELKDYDTDKGTIRFRIEKPIPTALLKKIVAFRVLENEAKALAKKTKKSVKK